MRYIKALVESAMNESDQLDESLGAVGGFIRNRNMDRFRFKFFIRGTTRHIFIQTDRREFYSVELKGRNLMTSEIEELSSLPEAEEAARQKENDGFRLVTTERDFMTVLNAFQSGLERRSATFSANELPVVSPLVYASRMTREPTEEEPRQGYPAFIGRGWWRIIEGSE